MSEDREIAMGIVTNPGRLSGVPTVKGTRIPARMVADLMAGDRPMSPVNIIESYPSLTYHDISNVKSWASVSGRDGDR